MGLILDTVPSYWSLDPGTKEPFYAVVMVDEDTDRVVVATNYPKGDWANKSEMFADLMSPQYAFADWDIEQVDAKSVPDGWQEFEPENSLHQNRKG